MASILIVEDRAELRELLQEVLHLSGYEVALAKNGAEALDYYRRDEPDLVILDMFMPVLNGFDALFILMRDYPEANVIAMSGGGSDSGLNALHEARALGAQMTLQKPFPPQKLVEAVATVLANGGA